MLIVLARVVFYKTVSASFNCRIMYQSFFTRYQRSVKCGSSRDNPASVWATGHETAKKSLPGIYVIKLKENSHGNLASLFAKTDRYNFQIDWHCGFAQKDSLTELFNTFFFSKFFRANEAYCLPLICHKTVAACLQGMRASSFNTKEHPRSFYRVTGDPRNIKLFYFSV